MKKSYKVKIIPSVGEAQTLEIASSKLSATTTLSAIPGGHYQLLETASGQAPDNIRVSRKGKDLRIHFEGSEQADLVISNYYANISQAALQVLARDVAEASFNRITVDGDTSTNDSLTLIATNHLGNTAIDSWEGAQAQALRAAIIGVARQLAQAIVRDGEGATKFITVQVDGGRDAAECRLAAYAIAHSPLVKTAFFASDPNLGRILAAVGYAGIADLDQTRIALYLDDVHVVAGGGRNPAYREEDGQRVMRQSEITVRVDLGRGSASDTVWTCDLSHDYVTINADYRS